MQFPATDDVVVMEYAMKRRFPSRYGVLQFLNVSLKMNFQDSGLPSCRIIVFPGGVARRNHIYIHVAACACWCYIK